MAALVGAGADDEALDEAVEELVSFAHGSALARNGEARDARAGGWGGGCRDAAGGSAAEHEDHRFEVLVEGLIVFAELFVEAAGAGAELDFVGMYTDERMQSAQGEANLSSALVKARDLTADVVVAGYFLGPCEGA